MNVLGNELADKLSYKKIKPHKIYRDLCIDRLFKKASNGRKSKKLGTGLTDRRE